MMTHHSVMTSSVQIFKKKINKFGDFWSDIDYNSKTDVFRVIFFKINQCEPSCPKSASGGHRMSFGCANEACLFCNILRFRLIVICTYLNFSFSRFNTTYFFYGLLNS